LRHEYGACRRKGEHHNCFFDINQGEKLGINGYVDWNPGDWVPDKECTYLRIERQGNRVRKTASPDGKKWSPLITEEETELPRKLKVGLAAYSTSTEPFKVRFDQIKLIQGRKDGK
jgi:regulation of enolase protein 1 (concanavalin A-like superfamily)